MKISLLSKIIIVLIFLDQYGFFFFGCASNCNLISPERNSGKRLSHSKIYIIKTIDDIEFKCYEFQMTAESIVFTTIEEDIINMTVPLKNIKEIKRCEAGGEWIIVSGLKILLSLFFVYFVIITLFHSM